MGVREIFRVPLDFDWPLGKPWQGYVNPYYVECTPCSGTGSTPGEKRLDDVLRLLFQGEKEFDSGHPSTGYVRSPDWFASAEIVPSSDYADLCGRLAVHPDGMSPRDKGQHRDIYSARHKLLSAAGLDPDSWGECTYCSGHGIPHDALARHEEWRETDPPEGIGYQAWRCSGEGCPTSRVFADIESLVDWLMANEIDVGTGRPGTREEWTRLARGETVMLSFKCVT